MIYFAINFFSNEYLTKTDINKSYIFNMKHVWFTTFIPGLLLRIGAWGDYTTHCLVVEGSFSIPYGSLLTKGTFHPLEVLRVFRCSSARCFPWVCGCDFKDGHTSTLWVLRPLRRERLVTCIAPKFSWPIIWKPQIEVGECLENHFRFQKGRFAGSKQVHFLGECFSTPTWRAHEQWVVGWAPSSILGYSSYSCKWNNQSPRIKSSQIISIQIK